MNAVNAISARTPIRGPAPNLKVQVEKSAEKDAPKKSFPEPRVFDRDGNGKVDVMDVVQDRISVAKVAVPPRAKEATAEYQQLSAAQSNYTDVSTSDKQTQVSLTA
ncbi:MAG: hypothetical protein K1X79_13125 [Oligoflexia bacterium]|nr:hypothetical protein [Oligoflexia bacterium]